ncbi:response regulator transcription factor [Bordetella avium]|uniref:response regulator transcription factor n=2 Tax=Bordetella avium TaxID=521 RepID=UPI000E09E614|nr:response regulator transcription factor [Bordetella avium]AZY47700.1 DNA-binding response regulator [Bordetella avium]AZY51070.1 DNA-binding response regulator [Bordetella avium]RIQ15074.1 response regulator [Bordetella avium]RIQ18435.1 response regulator [Bordetella avium]RIQ35528.1 response regulator [Bordetella avium]
MKHLSTLIMVPDSASRARIIAVLLQAGISTKGCSTPLELFGMLNEEHYDIVVLDCSDLGELGFSLIARLRGSAELGIVVKASEMPMEMRLRCLQSGADAALTEPLDDRELAGVLLALARRLPAWREDASDSLAGTLSGPGKWELRDQDWTLAAPLGATLSLSANERSIVRVLLQAGGNAVSRELLAEELSADGASSRMTGTRSIDVVISRLRRKAELAGLNLPIRTVYGSGYLFAQV